MFSNRCRFRAWLQTNKTHIFKGSTFRQKFAKRKRGTSLHPWSQNVILNLDQQWKFPYQCNSIAASLKIMQFFIFYKYNFLNRFSYFCNYLRLPIKVICTVCLVILPLISDWALFLRARYFRYRAVLPSKISH